MTSSGKWKKSFDGWWSCDFWEQLKFKFMEGGDQLQRCSRQDPAGDGDVSTIQLQLALQNATDLSVDCYFRKLSSDLLQILARVLQKGDNPVPILKSLSFSSCTPDVWRPILDAVLPQKRIQLKSFPMDNMNLGGAGYVMYDAIGSSHFPNVSSLTILNCDLKSDDVRYMAASLKRAGGSLRDLTLRSNALGIEGHLALAEVMMSRQLVHLETLDLNWTDMNGASCAAYAEAVDSGCLTALKELNFGYNEIGPEGHMHLAMALESGHQPCLEILKLMRTGIDDACCNAYCKGFASGRVQSLKSLDFSGNKIGPEGFQALTEAQESEPLPCLENLELSNSEIGDDGVKVLCAAFASLKLKKVTTIHLRKIKFGDEGLEAIVQCIKAGHLPDLKHLDLRYSLFSQAGFSLLGSALASGAANSLEMLLIDGPVRENILPILNAFSQNKLLVAHVDWNWRCSPSRHRLRVLQKFRDRNLRHVQQRKDLGGGSVKLDDIGTASELDAVESGVLPQVDMEMVRREKKSKKAQLVSLNHHQKSEVCLHKMENPSLTNREMINWIDEKFHLKVSPSTVSRCLSSSKREMKLRGKRNLDAPL